MIRKGTRWIAMSLQIVPVIYQCDSPYPVVDVCNQSISPTFLDIVNLESMTYISFTILSQSYCVDGSGLYNFLAF